MNLHSRTHQGNFYESFSDIIFATMTIFVLLMAVFIVLVQESSPVRIAEKELMALEAELEQKQEQMQIAENRIDELSDEAFELSKRDIEIAIAVDKSGSMEQELYNLKRAIGRLAALLPQISESVKLSIVSYRIRYSYDGGGEQIDVFPMTRILAASEDGGQSMRQLDSYLGRQTHFSGMAPVLKATQIALSQFSPQSAFDGHQVFMLLGDVGPYEISEAVGDEITSEGTRRANQLVSDISAWVKAKEDRNIIILFSGRDEVNARGFDTTAARRHKHTISMDLFREIAEQAGQPDAFTENQSSMFEDFLVAALKRK